MISRSIILKESKHWYKFDFEYLPKEWRKRESNWKMNILWKLERYEKYRWTQKVTIKEKDMNLPQVVKRIEGSNNCIDGYTSVGSYLTKIHKQKAKLIKNKTEIHKHDRSQNCSQKILFTINNPKIKEGDHEVEDINLDSENDIGEDKDVLNWSYQSYQKKKMNDLNDEAKAFSIPKSMSINNNDHSKGPNLFLLKDRIIGASNDSISERLNAIVSLSRFSVTRGNILNYQTVLRDISNNLHSIRDESLLIKTIELLQFRGSDALVDNLSNYLDHTLKNTKIKLVEAYEKYNSSDILYRSYIQMILRIWIAKLKEEGELFPTSNQRKPYFKLGEDRGRNHRLEVKSANRVYEMSTITR